MEWLVFRSTALGMTLVGDLKHEGKGKRKALHFLRNKRVTHKNVRLVVVLLLEGGRGRQSGKQGKKKGKKKKRKEKKKKKEKKNWKVPKFQSFQVQKGPGL